MMDQGAGTIIDQRDPQIRRAPNASGLYDVLDLILDKGLVIDAFARVSLVGIELLTIDLRIVVASVDTYLRYAEGAERLQLYNRSQSTRLPDFVGKMQKGKTIGKGVEKAADALTDGNKDQGEEEGSEQHEGGLAETIGRGVRNVGSHLAGMIGGGESQEGNEDEGNEDESRGSRRSESARGGGSRKQDRGASGNGHGRARHAK